MKKQEYIQLHALLNETRENIESRYNLDDLTEEIDSKSAEKYRKHGVTHTSIHRSKADHKKALKLIADIVTEGIEQVGPVPNSEHKEIIAETEELDD